MRLYGFWRSSATYRVRVALALKGLAATEVPVDIDHGGQDEAAFRAINPGGAVPALVEEDGAAPLTQSVAILEYLEERHPEPPLLPPDAPGRARVRALAATVATDAHPLIVPRVRTYLTAQAGFGPEQWRAWQGHWIGAALRTVESRLADPAAGRFCHGDGVTMADICLMSALVTARVLRLDLPALPGVARVEAACAALPAFAAADPRRQPDAPPA